MLHIVPLTNVLLHLKICDVVLTGQWLAGRPELCGLSFRWADREGSGSHARACDSGQGTWEKTKRKSPPRSLALGAAACH